MSVPVRKLQAFGQAWRQENVRMANYTTARVGGTVLGLVPVIAVLKSCVKQLRSCGVKVCPSS